eukprot:123630_1
MKQKSEEYKKKLSTRMKSLANQRSLLSSTKNQCEQKIHNSSVTTLQGAQQRANKTVQLIDETLLSVQKNHSDVRVNQKIHVKFDIDKSAINNGIQQWGVVTMIGDKPPPPKINFVQVSEQKIVVELLCDSNIWRWKSIAGYEISISPHEFVIGGPFHHSSDSFTLDDDDDNDSSLELIQRRSRRARTSASHPPASHTSRPLYNEPFIAEVKQDSEHITKEITNTNEQNVVFDSMEGLNHSTEYNIRGRVVLEDGQTGEWSQWSAISTPTRPMGSRLVQSGPHPISQYQYILPTQNKEYFNLKEGCQL